jgi:thiamine pyrophosphate-dependent acetolactate synthase large subunit-like protein
MFTEIDFVSIAKAFGARGFRIENPEDIASTLKDALNINGPVILEAVIDQDEKFPLTRRAIALKDSLGLPKVMKSISINSLSALLKMFKNKER